jgi:alkylation response protein AidB-like acyl-CoA dehydrogenase
MACASIRSTRYFIEQTFIWANVRQAFGKRLIDQPSIRQDFAKMFADVEAAQAWLEQISYNMCLLDYKQQSDLLAGQIGLLKAFATRVAHHASDKCVQIFGGRGITKTGMGSLIEGGFTFQVVRMQLTLCY